MGRLEGGYQEVMENSDALLLPGENQSSIHEDTNIDTYSLKEQHLNSITYEQLDKLKPEDRLQFITLGQIDAKKLKPGSKIVFDFHNNKKLYNKTSASFVFPSNILDIEAGGKIFRREKGKGEFFNKKGVRLIIGDSSNLNRRGYSVVGIDKVKKEFKSIREKEYELIIENSIEENLSTNILPSISNISDLNNLNLGSQIDFDFRGNKELYKKTSAGSIVPEHFKFLKTPDGKIWIKNDTKGEFFNKEGKRLAIGDSKFIGYSSLEIISEAEISKVSTYLELLNLNINYRLQNITDFEGDSSSIEKGKEIKFNFKNSSLSNSSLGEVMPIDIREIMDSSGNSYTRLPVNRLGEFLDSDMNRLRIKDGDSIKIGLVEYPKVIENKIKQHSNEIKSKDYKDFIRKQVNSLSNEYGVPEKYVYSLLKGENQFWDYTLKVNGRDNTAYGLLQMTNDTWSKWGKGLDRFDPTDQLRAGIKYMKYIQELKKCDWLMAMTLYHTGPSILRVNSKKIAINLKWNPGIRNIIKKIPGIDMDNITAKEYLDGAYEYYKGKLV